MTSSTLTALLPLLVAAFVVVRFALRELRERKVKSPGIWIRPAILGAISLYVIVATFVLDPHDDGVTVVSLLIGAALGALTGVAVIRNSTFAPAPEPRAILVRGSRVTLAIWIGALALRLVARFLYPSGGDPLAQLPLNCGTVMLITVAFIVIALAFQREIGKRAASLIA